MKELIARLEAATEGSRELDLAICEAIGGCGDDGGRTCPNLCYSYSTSIDAALTLANGNWFDICGEGVEFFATIEHGHPPDRRSGSGSQGTPALALCIAALKARG